MPSHATVNHGSTPTRNGPNWAAVLLFYAIACGISWPFFWWKDVHPDISVGRVRLLLR
jgi:hypothetical protein